MPCLYKSSYNTHSNKINKGPRLNVSTVCSLPFTREWQTLENGERYHIELIKILHSLKFEKCDRMCGNNKYEET